MGITSSKLQSFVKTVNASGDNDRLVMEGRTVRNEGRRFRLFTDKVRNRETGAALLKGIREQYGDTVADSLSGRLSAVITQGKPLTARVASDVLHQALSVRESLHLANVSTGVAFCYDRNLGSEDHPTLRGALHDFRMRMGDITDYRKLLSAASEELMQQLGQNADNKILSRQELAERVENLPSVVEARYKLNARVVSAAFPDGKPSRAMEAAANVYATRTGLNAEERKQYLSFVQMGAHLAEGFLDSQNDLYEAVALGALRGIEHFRYALDLPHPANRSFLLDSAHFFSDKAGEFAALGLWGVPDGAKADNCFALAAVAAHYDAIRSREPSGLPSRNVLWEECCGEMMPKSLRDAPGDVFMDAMGKRLHTLYREAHGGDNAESQDPGRFYAGKEAISYGFRQTAVDAAMEGRKTQFTLADMIGKVKLYGRSKLDDMDAIEKSIAKDFNRLFKEPSTSVTFVTGSGSSGVVRLDNSMLEDPEDREDHRQGRSSSVTRSLIARTREMCNGSEIQSRVLVQCMGQAGAFLAGMATRLLGAPYGGLSGMNMTLTRLDSGDVQMAFQTGGRATDIAYAFIVRPDGDSELISLDVHLRP